MSNNVGITAWSEGQAHPEVTTNNSFGRFDAFLTETLAISVSGGNVVVTAAQAQQAYRYTISGATVAGRTVTLPSVKGMKLVESAAANTQTVSVKRGSGSVVLSPGESALIIVDGTTNGIEILRAATSVVIRDEVTSFLAAGSGISVTRGGSPDKLTIAATGGGGGSVPNGGTTSQVLTKLSSTDQDCNWVTPSGGGDVNPLTGELTLVKPTSGATFTTWVNQDSGTITDRTRSMVLGTGTTKTAASVQQRLRSLPGGASWTVTLGVWRGFPWKNFMDCGLVLRESATGKLETLGFGNPGGGFQQVKWTSPTASSAVRTTLAAVGGNEPLAYFKAVLASGNIQCSISMNGVDYFDFGAAFAQNNFLTTGPDQWGLFLNGNNNATPNINAYAGAFHWDEHT